MLTGNYALHLALFSKDPHVAIQIFFNENEMKFKIQFLSHTGHMWLEATILDCIDAKHIFYHPEFY